MKKSHAIIGLAVIAVAGYLIWRNRNKNKAAAAAPANAGGASLKLNATGGATPVPSAPRPPRGTQVEPLYNSNGQLYGYGYQDPKSGDIVVTATV